MKISAITFLVSAFVAVLCSNKSSRRKKVGYISLNDHKEPCKKSACRSYFGGSDVPEKSMFMRSSETPSLMSDNKESMFMRSSETPSLMSDNKESYIFVAESSSSDDDVFGRGEKNYSGRFSGVIRSKSSDSSSSKSTSDDQDDSSCEKAEEGKSNDDLFKGISKEFNFSKKSILAMISSFSSKISNIIMSNVKTILSNPKKYIHSDSGSRDLDVLIGTIKSDGNTISNQAKEKLKTHRKHAIEGITREIGNLMNCALSHLSDSFKKCNVRGLQGNVVHYRIDDAIYKITSNSREKIYKFVNEMYEKQRDVLKTENKKGEWKQYNEYIEALGDIREVVIDSITSSLEALNKDAVGVGKKINDEIKAVTNKDGVAVEGALKRLSNLVLSMTFRSPSPVGSDSEEESPNSPKPDEPSNED